MELLTFFLLLIVACLFVAVITLAGMVNEKELERAKLERELIKAKKRKNRGVL